MKITLEPRKTTWVPFIDSKANMEIEWKAKIAYEHYSAHQNNTHSVDMRYIFKDLNVEHFIPSSQLIIKEAGIPLTITESVVSPVKDRFKSERISDPFVEIDDKLASIDKTKVVTKQLSKRVIERSWSETIRRSIRIENKTGKKVELELTLVDKPAEELIFVSSTPKPKSIEAPEYIYKVELEPDAVEVIKVELKVKNVEKINLPPDHVKMRGEKQEAIQELSQNAIQEFVECEVQEEEF